MYKSFYILLTISVTREVGEKLGEIRPAQTGYMCIGGPLVNILLIINISLIWEGGEVTEEAWEIRLGQG